MTPRSRAARIAARCPARSPGRRRRASRRCRGRRGDGHDRLGRPDGGHVPMMPDGRAGARRRVPRPQLPRPARRATRGRPARSSSTARPIRAARAAPATMRLALVGADLEERDPASARAPGAGEQPPDDLKPVGAAIERDDRLERRRARQPGDHIRPDVRQVGEDEVERRDRRPAAGSRPRRTHPSATAWPTAFSRASPSASARDVGREDLDRLERAAGAETTARATAIAPLPGPDVHDPERRRRRRAGRRSEPAHDLGLGQLDEPLRLRPRDERPASTSNASP